MDHQGITKRTKIHYTQISKHRELKWQKKKLTYIIKRCWKDFYSKILDDNKKNAKGLWNILDSVIRNGSKQISYPQYFIDHENYIWSK